MGSILCILILLVLDLNVFWYTVICQLNNVCPKSVVNYSVKQSSNIYVSHLISQFIETDNFVVHDTRIIPQVLLMSSDAALKQLSNVRSYGDLESSSKAWQNFNT